ncbi:hypothetical protein T10_6399 [Trichinella papuae]|uniref:Uncharacterized protein n=1 Tax=Trichinella papuae TaxID=268474 RepID=A0A0V1MVP7_9BILA|nr:hypothetical protein T10_6399 [Trichinella papuae]
MGSNFRGSVQSKPVIVYQRDSNSAKTTQTIHLLNHGAEPLLLSRAGAVHKAQYDFYSLICSADYANLPNGYWF